MDTNDIHVSNPDYIVFVPEGKLDVRGVGVSLRVDGDGAEAHRPHAADDATGDLAAVGHEHAVEWGG